MQLTVKQSSAIYFKRHKGSKRRVALFRKLRASAANQTCDVKQQTFGDACNRAKASIRPAVAEGSNLSMRRAMRHARGVRRTALQGEMSKRKAAQSSDQEVMRHLSRSHIFKDYETSSISLSGFHVITLFPVFIYFAFLDGVKASFVHRAHRLL
jgi:hypothetical protein